MWNTLALPWQACLEEAWEAYCMECLPIGAVVTGPDGQILSRGGNRIAVSYGEHPLAHAELNALLQLDYETLGAATYQCMLYTTTEPCPLCMGAFYMSNLRQLHFAARDPHAGSVDLVGASVYMSLKHLTIHGPENNPALEILTTAMNSEYQLRSRGEQAFGLLNKWRAVLPEGVRLGESLFESGALQEMCKENASAAQMVDALALQVDLFSTLPKKV
jgi:tRNA(adenine34) deaminase